MEKEYTIVFSTKNLKKDSNIIQVRDEGEFIEWYFKNKSILKQAKIKFITKLEHITIDSIKSLYKFLKFYQHTKKLCDTHMTKYNKDLLAVKENKEVKQALQQLVRVNEGGKYLRAALIALGYKSMGKKDNKYLNLSIALEIFQTSILIHDDIIDNDDMRRGKETVPCSYRNFYNNPKTIDKDFEKRRYDIANSMGICIGDLGFYLANGIIIDGYKDSPYLYDILSYYNEMVIKTCKGEMLDVTLPFTQYYFDKCDNLNEKIMEIYKLKTAWYSVVGPFCLGMILAGADKKEVKKMEEILVNVGIAFQIKDDILGVFGNCKVTGKSNCSDIEEYKQTILYSFVMNSKYKDELLKYYGKKTKTNDIKKVIDIFDKSGAYMYAKTIMNDLFQSGLDNIEKVNIDKKHKDIIKGFIIYLRHRSK